MREKLREFWLGCFMYVEDSLNSSTGERWKKRKEKDEGVGKWEKYKKHLLISYCKMGFVFVYACASRFMLRMSLSFSFSSDGSWKALPIYNNLKAQQNPLNLNLLLVHYPKTK
ncbi:unnamed protein product [Prunus brigantina]